MMEEHSPTPSRSAVDEMPVGALSSASREIYKGVHEFNMEQRGRESVQRSKSRSGQSPPGTQTPMFRGPSPEMSPMSPTSSSPQRRPSLCPSVEQISPRA
eukprot:CAMPEP_0177749434 /NCGR_PEP_ID=MMETSP0484_2-20121128/32484_1 /TAXON_ID=354590 /ORGANISM="Rhodomonas lens, Strain RHODO" /LENGTH=99 /DNA_ID=CAMNT_0019264417 /DNA_START=55 /DNA_END=350 /DNA_ORIENTATION=+